MKRFLWTALLALPFCAQSAQAQYCCAPSCPPWRLEFCACGLSLNFFGGGGQTQLGPWYQYWPLDAHFQMPPPLGQATAGPSYMTLAPQFSQPQVAWTPPAPAPIPATPSVAGGQPPMYQPGGFHYPSAAPNYWYGR